MKRFSLLLCTISFWILPYTAYSIAPTPSGESASQLISIDLQDAEIKSTLRMLADMKKLNFVIDKGVVGTVTIKLKDVTWEEAFQAILSLKGLHAQKWQGGFYIVPVFNSGN